MSALWAWAVRTYASPGVAEACLALQDEHEQSVPLILWALWAARHGRSPDAETLERAAETARAWESAVGAHLRAARRNLKPPAPGIPDEARLRFREQLKAFELAGERLLLDALEPMATVGDGQEPEDALLARVSAAWGVRLPPQAFAELLARL